jgi:predicted TIM-barrel fold metal-dependent hydrolase
MAKNGGRLKKRFSIFDCDAHINDPYEIWTKYVEPEYREAVKKAYWRDEQTNGLLNGVQPVMGGDTFSNGAYNPICIAGPGMSKKLMRKFQQMKLTDEQVEYLYHKGAIDPKARIRDLDLMGIDQVLVIPTMVVMHYPYIQNTEGAYGLARAYNNWARDWCDVVPDRLFPAGWLPVQSAEYTAAELQRIAKMKFPVGLVRPIDAQHNYPNQLDAGWDKVYRAFEETQIVLGMHTFPPSPNNPDGSITSPGTYINKTGYVNHQAVLEHVAKMGAAPAQLEELKGVLQAGGSTQEISAFLTKAGLMKMDARTTGNALNLMRSLGGRFVDGQTLSFVYEAMAWLSQVLLSGFLDRYPRLKMAIFESNATWLTEMLERCDTLFKLYKNERARPAQRLPSEAFYQQCMIAFESDEVPVFRQWDKFENVGIWSSDAYHHDGADSWSAMREMNEVEVPEAVQAKLLGGNARRFYGIEGKMFVTEEVTEIPRPAWFPNQESEEFKKWWDQEVYPRRYGRTASAASGASVGSY